MIISGYNTGQYNQNRVQNKAAVYFAAAKQGIKGEEVARTTITYIDPATKREKDIEVIVALENRERFPGRYSMDYRVYSTDKKLLGRNTIEDTSINKKTVYDRKYGINWKNNDYIFGCFIEASDDKRYKGIGQKLIQISIEQSIKSGHDGRFKFEADSLVPNSKVRELPSNYGCPTGFYYEKCHFRCDPYYINEFSWTDEKIEKELKRIKDEGKHPSEANINIVKMYLPEEEFRDFWWSKIKKDPIILSEREIKEFDQKLKTQAK